MIVIFKVMYNTNVESRDVNIFHNNFWTKISTIIITINKQLIIMIVRKDNIIFMVYVLSNIDIYHNENYQMSHLKINNSQSKIKIVTYINSLHHTVFSMLFVYYLEYIDR